jgi:hypothetical protein
MKVKWENTTRCAARLTWMVSEFFFFFIFINLENTEGYGTAMVRLCHEIKFVQICTRTSLGRRSGCKFVTFFTFRHFEAWNPSCKIAN